MLQVSGIWKRYGEYQILADVSFVVNSGERVGLVGPNGCGKTTLLRIIMGDEQADAGGVRLAPGDARLGYLAQGLEYAPDATVGQVMREAQPGLLEAQAEMRDLEARMSQGDEPLAELMAAYSQAQGRYERLGGYEMAHRIDAVLAGLDLADLDHSVPVDILSGGQKTRLGLARLLLATPHILLLDEPTNHLDIEALEWLEGFLRRYEGAVVIVSHDRTFLDNTVSSILALDPETHTVAAYVGGYTDYAQAQDRALEQQWQQYKDQQDKIARLRGEVRTLRGRAIRTEHSTIHFHLRKIAKKTARRAVVQQRRIQRMLDAEDHVEKPEPTWNMKLAFPEVPESGQEVLVAEGLAMAYGDNALFDDVDLVLRQGERIALLGANGTGKTTLLKLIAGELAPAAGQVRLGAGVRVGYYSQEQETLELDSSPLQTIHRSGAFSETDARSFLHYFLFAGDDVFKRVGDLSYGERARLALATLVAGGCNLLLLDEPINHLDIPSRESFEQAMAEYEGTVLAVVHDRYFVQRFATGIWALQSGTVRPCVDLADMQRARTTPPSQ